MLRFAYFQKLVNRHVFHFRTRPRRPPYLNSGGLSVSQTKVDTLIVRGNITSGRRSKSRLPIDANSRAQTIAIAVGAAKRNRQPAPRAAPIHQDNRVPSENG